MKFNLKTKIAGLFRKCANYIEHETFSDNSILLPDSLLRPYILECETKRIETLQAQIRHRLYPDEHMEDVEQHYIYPRIAETLGDELMKAGFIKVVRENRYGETLWTAKLNVVK